MWLISNSPARVRTARCSAAMPAAYSSGMSQPLNGTILAPELRWRALSGVFFSGADVACSMRWSVCVSGNRQRYYAPRRVVKADAWSRRAHLSDDAYVDIGFRAVRRHHEDGGLKRVADARAL